MVCPPAISEAGARRPNVLSNYGVLCPTRITRTLVNTPEIAAAIQRRACAVDSTKRGNKNAYSQIIAYT
jgi:hypothetical protein